MRIVLTYIEKEMIGVIVGFGGEFSSSSKYDGFADKYKQELRDFREIGFLEHYNQESEGAYARYRFSDIAHKYLQIPTQSLLL